MTEVDQVHEVTYRRLLPLLVLLGVIANVLCLAVLIRPALRVTKVNSYLLALSVCDLMVCVFHIPVIVTITGCTFSTYCEAFYFTHFGWTLVGVFQTFGTYTILWLSLDRFMAVWMYDLYPRIQQRPHVIRNRLLVTGFMCLALHVVYMTNAEVKCSSWKLDNQTDINCDQGEWVGTSGYQRHYEDTWHEIFRVIYSLVIRWIPNGLLLAFNVGLVVGVCGGRVTFPSASHANAERHLVTTTIAITVSFILLTLPIIIYITGFAYKSGPDRCTAGHKEEILRAVGNCLQLLEHVIHIFFLAGLNKGFRRELKIFLRLEESTKGEPDVDGEEGVAGASTGHQLRPPRSNIYNSNSQIDRSISPNVSTRNTPVTDI